MNLPLWFSNLLSWSAQVALLVLAAGLLPRLFQILHPRVLLIYWRALLAVSLLLPVVQPRHRAASISVLALPPDVPGAHLPPPSTPPAAHWQFPNIQYVAQVLGAVILAGIAVRVAILLLGLLKLRQLRRASAAVTQISAFAPLLDSMTILIDCRVEFRLSAKVDSPVTFGLVAPVVLLPARFQSMDTRFQSAIVCHELLHVRRRDWAHHVGEEIIRALFWFHPAIAWLVSQVRLSREQVVDLEVVRLTQARKPYLEALMEFASGRASAAPIPAPPFLAERQLVERVSLMLKEVRMSRTKLIASLSAVSCCLVLVIALAAWTFPLKAAPRPAQNAPQNAIAHGISGGVAQGISGGVAGGVSSGVTGAPARKVIAGGVSGGISAGVARGVSGTASRDIPIVEKNSIWTDTVKRGPMLRQVRGLGKLVRPEDSSKLVAKITVPVFLTVDVRPNQSATVDTRMGLVKGHVVNITAGPDGDTRAVIIALDAPLPERADVDLSIDATIDIEKLENVLYVARPVHSTSNSSISLFKIAKDGLEAQRVTVKFGRVSVNSIEVLDGLKEGDQIILSDMSQWDNADRIRLK